MEDKRRELTETAFHISEKRSPVYGEDANLTAAI